jgi:hypothetical protein
MPGDALIEPALELGGEMNEMGSHWRSPLQVPGLRANEPGDAQYGVSNGYSISR